MAKRKFTQAEINRMVQLRPDLVAAYLGAHGRQPNSERIPGASPAPAEDDALFNPLVHGNRRMGKRRPVARNPVPRKRRPRSRWDTNPDPHLKSDPNWPNRTV